MSEPRDLSLAAASRAIAAGRLKPSRLVEDLLDRVAAREPRLRAWAAIDADRLRAAARALDDAPARGPLHGVPVAVKDLIDTADLPTGYGSDIYRGHRPDRDAACVARLRAAGGLIMGKTVTNEFAYSRPAATRNPRNPAYVPGGSSGGSAAAVADGMVPAALGTQTGGSIVGPAAYCGVIGYKPARGTIPTAGLKFVAPSIDTIGFLCRSLDDIPPLMAALARRRLHTPRSDAPAVAVCRTDFYDRARAPVRRLLEDTAARLAEAGVPCRDVELPPAFAELEPASQPIINSECLVALGPEAARHGERIGEEMRELLEKARAIPAEGIAQAWRSVNSCRMAFPRLFAPGEVILTPSVGDEPSRDPADLGDGIFSRTWMMLDAPCLHLPLARGPNGMPIGLQLVAPDGDEDALLAAARRLARVLAAPLFD